MTTARLKWISFAGLALFVLGLDRVRQMLYADLRTPGGRALLAGLVFTAGIFLLGLLFAFLQRQEQSLERQRAELLALHHAALDLGGELGQDQLLQKVVDGARALIGARYGALSVLDSNSRIEVFVVSGLSAAVKEQIGEPPVGHGVLGVVLEDGQRLRISSILDHPRAKGFPAHHPAMGSLLAVPIQCRSPFRGNLYLADREAGGGFSAGDEDTLVRFATQAANAIDAVHLHQQLRTRAIEEERLRLAREMHDGTAQVLASVNARAQAIREFVRTGRDEEAIAQLERLAADAREVHAEVREGILALRVTASEQGLAATLREFLDDWQDQTGIAVEDQIDLAARLQPVREVQALRIAQEALANVRKHSGAKNVRLRLSQDERLLRLEIEDDGKGFDLERPAADGRPHFGLLTMRERAASIASRLEIHAEPGRGSTVCLEVPIGRGIAPFQGGTS